MASAGPLSPGSAASAGSGDVAWSSAGNVLASDDSRATAALTAAQTTTELQATTFGFAIPVGATVNGITVEWEKARDGPTKNITDSAVRIIKGGATGATDKSNAGVNWALGDAYDSYGGAADLWGETWTPAQINASDFGASLKATSATNGQAQVDHCRITVTYTEAAFDPASGSPWEPQVERTQKSRTRVATYGHVPGVN